MYYYHLLDILFFIKSVKFPSRHFNINNYVHFCNQSTRSSTSYKIKHTYSSTNRQKNHYFNRLPRIYNALPAIKSKSTNDHYQSCPEKYFWDHFIRNFNNDNMCTYHFVCPCCNCSKIPQPSNFMLPLIHCKNSGVKVTPWCHSHGCSDNASVLLQHSGCYVNTYELPQVSP